MIPVNNFVYICINNKKINKSCDSNIKSRVDTLSLNINFGKQITKQTVWLKYINDIPKMFKNVTNNLKNNDLDSDLF